MLIHKAPFSVIQTIGRTRWIVFCLPTPARLLEQTVYGQVVYGQVVYGQVVYGQV